MKVNQIADALNTVFEEITGTWTPTVEGETNPALYKEDLSNFIDAGRVITSTTEWGNNFDHYVKKLIDVIGKTVIVDKSLELKGIGLLRDKYEFGALLQKIRVGEIDFTETAMWQLEPGEDYDYNTFNPVDISADYYSEKVTYSMEWSWIAKVLKGSLDSMDAIIKLFSAIENKILKKVKLMSIAMEMRLLNNANGRNILHGKTINLLEEYQNSTGDTTTPSSHFLAKRECLQSAYVTFNKYKAFLGYPTKRFNLGEELNWTNANDLHFVTLTDIEAGMGAYLMADTFHNEFVNLSGYATVATWQGIAAGADGLSFDNRSGINVGLTEKVYNAQSARDDKMDPIEITYSGIVACMFDNTAVAVYNEDAETNTAPPNPKGKFINYFYSYDQSNYYDDKENFITFVLSDYAVVSEEPSDWETNYDDYFILDSDGSYKAVEGVTSGSDTVAPDFDEMGVTVYRYLISA